MSIIAIGALKVQRLQDMTELGEVGSYLLTANRHRPYCARRFATDQRGMCQVVDSEWFSSIDEALAYVSSNPHYPAPEEDVVACERTGVRRLVDLPGGHILALPIEERSGPGPFVNGCQMMPLICAGDKLVLRIRKNDKSFSVHGQYKVTPCKTLEKVLKAAILACVPKDCSGHERMAWEEAAMTVPARLIAGGHFSHIGRLQP